MKFSEAMLKAFEQVGGRQCRGQNRKSDRHGHAIAYCVGGAARAGGYRGQHGRFLKAWRESPIVLNDKGMPWEHIYGMAVAAGL